MPDRPGGTDSPDLKRLKADRDWNGYLTLENCEAVAARIRSMLEGNSYTWVACNESLRDYFPEVRTSMRAREVTVSRNPLDDGTPFASFNVLDSYGSWGLHTGVEDQPAARALGYGHKSLTYMHIVTQGHYNYGRIEVEQYAPAGFRVLWVIAVEAGEDKDHG